MPKFRIQKFSKGPIVFYVSSYTESATDFFYTIYNFHAFSIFITWF